MMMVVTRWISFTGWLLGSFCIQADWLQFRGSSSRGGGEVEELPVALAQDHVVWKAPLEGRGLSSPIVVGDQVVITFSFGPDQSRLGVASFSALTGEEMWRRTFWATGRTMTHEKTCVAAPTPASDGDRIFAFFSSNDVVCLDLRGNLQWIRGLGHDYPNASNSLGMSSSLVVAEDVLVVQVENDSESFTAGLDVGTGEDRWHLERPKAANWTSPVVFQRAGGGQVVALQSGKGVLGVDARTGKALWNFDKGASTIPSSTFADGILVVPSHGLTALRVSDDGTSFEQMWNSRQLTPSTPSPMILGHRVYVINNAGVLTCGDLADGKRLWQLRLNGAFSGTPVVSGKYLYALSEEGRVLVVDTLAEEGAVVGELDLGETLLSSPAISDGSLFFRSDSSLWKIGKRRVL